MDAAARHAARTGPPSDWTRIYMQTIRSLVPEDRSVSCTWYQHAKIAAVCDVSHPSRSGGGTDLAELLMRATAVLTNPDHHDFIERIALPSIPPERFLLLRSALQDALQSGTQRQNATVILELRVMEHLQLHADGANVLARMVSTEYERRAKSV
jgi:hypothetical protein